ncbi:MAG: ribosome small subunit-dependent GTPase A [Clostridiales bacterium]|nr:ribosome small subunit-dependent GTPase A [Clostridiales bacterium]
MIKGIGGFYYVEVADVLYECKARGLFRKDGIVPLAGDRVSIEVDDDNKGTVVSIGERKNYLIRPPVANIDRLFIVASTVEPRPSTLVIDKLTASAENKGITPVIVITKSDIKSSDELAAAYKHSGIKTISVCSVTGEGIDEVKAELKGRISAFAGNSGVGKSTLLNAIDKRLNLQTGEISDKLGRGRHTTRHIELYKTCGGYVADTPGFASFTLEEREFISKEDLPFCFPEFLPYLGKCKFSTCTHVCDKGCKIVEAVKNGEIDESRHNSYIAMYNEVKDIKEWNIK